MLLVLFVCCLVKFSYLFNYLFVFVCLLFIVVILVLVFGVDCC